jgi:hypothetical protein
MLTYKTPLKITIGESKSRNHIMIRLRYLKQTYVFITPIDDDQFGKRWKYITIDLKIIEILGI